MYLCQLTKENTMTSMHPPSLISKRPLSNRAGRGKNRRRWLVALALLTALALATTASAATEITKLTGNAGENADFFGSDVAFDGNVLADWRTGRAGGIRCAPGANADGAVLVYDVRWGSVDAAGEN